MRLSEADSHALAGAPVAPTYLQDGTTVMSWLNTRDHKRVGVMFLVSVILFFFLGGLFALLIRFKLLQPGPFFIDALGYNRMFTLHGVVMIFLFLIPSIPSRLYCTVTVHTLRAPGLSWMRLPLFVWGIYGTAIIQVLATPVIGITVLIVAGERVGGFGLFDPARGGDPVLFQHMFWVYSHPAVYIMVLPGMGVISETAAAFSRKNPFGYKAIAMSSLGIAFVGFFTWGHHMFVAGQSTFNAGAFGILSMFVGVFTAIKVFNWVGTMYRGAISFKTPVAYMCGFFYFLVFGGMTGVALATTSLDIHWHDTYFIIAHFHFIMVGASVMA